VGDLFDALDLSPFCGQIEQWAETQGYTQLIGLDEAGRGPLAGPVVAAAVALPAPCPIEGINDSKKLSERRREALYGLICEGALGYAVCVVERDEIDTLNILHASMAAMARAHQAMITEHPTLADALVLVDGNRRAPITHPVEQRPVVKGDARSLNIAAASILAKVTRDRIMVAYDQRWPMYGFAQHKGYPTAAHRAALREHGPCELHRRSFRLLGEPK
jgi:ribonuclease HII